MSQSPNTLQDQFWLCVGEVAQQIQSDWLYVLATSVHTDLLSST